MKEKFKLSWAVPAYHHNEKSVDWFWAFGIIIISASIISIIYKNYFFAFLVFLSGILMMYFASKEPETLYYELNEKGLKVKDNLYEYQKIKSFWIQIEETPILFIKTERFFLPVIEFSINKNVANNIKEIFTKENIKKEEMKESPANLILKMINY